MNSLPTADRRSFLGGSTIAAVAAISIPNMAFANGSPSVAWDKAMKYHLAAARACEAYGRAFDRENTKAGYKVPDHISDEYERLAVLAWESRNALMEIPAPHHAALLWKLDIILGVEPGESFEAWNEEYLRQTVADYRRLLGEA